MTRFVEILRAPDGGDLLLCGDVLASSNGGSWPVIDGAPNFLAIPIEGRSDHVSHPLPQKVIDMIARTPGLVLNLSAGGTVSKADNVVEVEWGLYRNTDISADAHDLPFKDGVFDGVVCLNSFEHYHDPAKVVSEIRRVLKPNGFVYVLTAFMQPYHMKPHHYFNVTPNGLRNWFREWRIEHCGATEFHNVILSLQWMASAALWALERDGAKPDVAGISLADLKEAWQGNWPPNVSTAHGLAAKLPQSLRDDAAHAVEIVAYKPEDGQRIDNPLPAPEVVVNAFKEEEIDGEVPETEKTVVVCFDSRTGSHLLCHYLGETGLFGFPGEYFNPDGKEEGYPRHPRSQLKIAKQRSTSPNGVFSFKIDPHRFDLVAPHLDVSSAFPNPYFVDIRRDDLLGQAISLVRAQQTGKWFSGEQGFSEELTYDAGAISRAMKDLSLRRERWNLFYARNGINPLRLTFEDIVTDPISAVSRVCTHCEIDWERVDLPAPTEYKRQSDHINAEWRERFIAERRGLHFLDPLP